MKANAWYGLITFEFIAFLGILGTIFYQAKPLTAMRRFADNFGLNFHRALESGAVEETSLKRFFSYFGSLLLGANYLAIFAAWLAFHDSNRLAWWSLSYFPLMFLWHFLITRKEDKSKWIQLFFLLLSISAWLLNM